MTTLFGGKTLNQLKTEREQVVADAAVRIAAIREEVQALLYEAKTIEEATGVPAPYQHDYDWRNASQEAAWQSSSYNC